MRDRRGARIKRCSGRQRTQERKRKERRKNRGGETFFFFGGGKPTWPPASRMSAVSRLVAIHYPDLLKYYAHWLMLTAWPEGGDCVGKCVCLHFKAPAAFQIPFRRSCCLPKSCKQHERWLPEGFVRSSREALPKINKYFTAGKMGLAWNWAVYAGGRCNFLFLISFI